MSMYEPNKQIVSIILERSFGFAVNYMLKLIYVIINWWFLEDFVIEGTSCREVLESTLRKYVNH